MLPVLPTSPVDGTSPKILLAIEQEWAARSLESVLTPNGYAVIRSRTGHETLDLAGRVAPDAMIVDSRLSDMDAIDVCRLLRAQDVVAAHVPIVLTTSGPASRDFVVAAHRAGVWGLWEQPLDGEVLLLRLDTWIRAKRVVDALDGDSLIDRDSGLYSLRGLTVRAREIMSDAARRSTPTSCVAVGPVLRGRTGEARAAQAVDPALLREIARTLAASSRASDAVGRIGNAEFAIVAPLTSADGAAELTHRLQSAIAHLVPSDLLTASPIDVRVGVATITEFRDAVHDPVDLLVRASAALRSARHAADPSQSAAVLR
jgi:diguanylate cyclase (GGDEF)-like protein